VVIEQAKGMLAEYRPDASFAAMAVTSVLAFGINWAVLPAGAISQVGSHGPVARSALAAGQTAPRPE
jgi:hypothetical protein